MWQSQRLHNLLDSSSHTSAYVHFVWQGSFSGVGGSVCGGGICVLVSVCKIVCVCTKAMRSAFPHYISHQYFNSFSCWRFKVNYRRKEIAVLNSLVRTSIFLYRKKYHGYTLTLTSLYSQPKASAYWNLPDCPQKHELLHYILIRRRILEIEGPDFFTEGTKFLIPP